MPLRPFRDYSGDYHVLGAAITFVHPITRTTYWCACEKKDTIGHQDFVVYRQRPGILEFEEVKRYRGKIDSPGVFTMGSAIIDTYGALLIATTTVLPSDPARTTTGFQAVWDWLPEKDAAWLGTDPGVVEALEQQVAGLQVENQALWDRIAALEASSGGLSEEEKDNLRWVSAVRAVE